jgi:thiamine pyrophosphate-dependent acetolactate synthase large subunit-like protein
VNILEAVQTLLDRRPEALYVAALGTATSALRTVSSDGPHLYFGGAMGSATPAALGIAERVAPRLVIAVVGDGELLMGTRTLWSIAGLRPTNLLVVVMADGRYTMTGGQRIEAPAVFAEPAAAIPGLHACRATSVSALAQAIEALPLPGVIEAVLDQAVTPSASPFVEPHRVRFAFEAELARGNTSRRRPRAGALTVTDPEPRFATHAHEGAPGQ